MNHVIHYSMINLLLSFMSKRVRRFGPSATDIVHVMVSRMLRNLRQHT